MHAWSEKWNGLIDNGIRLILGLRTRNNILVHGDLELPIHMLIFAYFSKGPEYGTMKDAWKGFLTEGQRVADFHSEIGGNLISVEVPRIQDWQKKNYPKVRIRDASKIYQILF